MQPQPPHEFQYDLDTIANIPSIKKILDVVCRTTGMRYASVSRVTKDRWVLCDVLDNVGTGAKPGMELELKTTICNTVVLSAQQVFIEDTNTDPDFKDHIGPKMYGFQSHVSVPINLPDGTFFGTLCALDPLPVSLSAQHIRDMFSLFAELIAIQIDNERKTATSEAHLLYERKTAELRDQFIAVLGHDLRNPLAAIYSGSEYLLYSETDQSNLQTIETIHASALRMSELIDNVLDLARGRLGGGVPIKRSADKPLTETLNHVVSELTQRWPKSTIESSFIIEAPIHCDRARVGQLFSNLLANALAHGAKDRPIRVDARVSDGSFELSVKNEGKPINSQVLQRIFEPFSRGSSQSTSQGLGLGLYIANEIAKAHNGTLAVQSCDEETKFTFRMPVR